MPFILHKSNGGHGTVCAPLTLMWFALLLGDEIVFAPCCHGSQQSDRDSVFSWVEFNKDRKCNPSKERVHFSLLLLASALELAVEKSNASFCETCFIFLLVSLLIYSWDVTRYTCWCFGQVWAYNRRPVISFPNLSAFARPGCLFLSPWHCPKLVQA